MPVVEKPQNWLQRPFKRALQFFSGLEIKYKLSINIAIIVVMVIVFFSALILPIQHRVLDNATMETCTYLLKKLSQNRRAIYQHADYSHQEHHKDEHPPGFHR